MSTIAGLWSWSSALRPAAQCRAMLDAMAALGPDGTAVAEHKCFAAGRSLFALLPEDKHDRQPIAAGEGRFLLVADVRIDDRDELGASLGLTGSALTDRADSDLLLHALLRWGDQTPDRLYGDFAFAWFDAARGRLLLARDPLGQRPLFWTCGPGFFAFASMPSGLHAVTGVERAPDLDALARYAAGLSSSGPGTIFAGLQRVEPGHVAIVTPDGVSARRYWDPVRARHRFASVADGVGAYRSVLDGAVRSRLRRPEGKRIASQLSGGWDSGAVSATAARLLAPSGERLLAYTAVPVGAVHALPANRVADEAPLASATAALHPDIDHRLVPSSGHSPISALDQAIAFSERPPFNPCNHGWLAHIRQEAQGAGARVLLTGDIGNWTISAAPPGLLADYVREGRWREWARESGAMLRQRRARLRGVVASSFGPWLPSPLWKRLSRHSSAAAIDLPLRPDFAHALAGALQEDRFGAASRPKDHWLRTRDALFGMDFGAYRKGVLAGWGVDERDPTADRALVEFCLALPLEMLLGGSERRPLARAALADRLPAAVLNERRKGVQAALWYHDLDRDLPRIRALIDAVEADPAADALIDTDRLRAWLRDWPTRDWNRPATVARYRVALLVALAAGQFAIQASGRKRVVPGAALG